MSSSIVDPSGKHSSHRVFEWTMALILFGMGMVLVFWPHSLSASRFSAFWLLFNGHTFTIVCLIVAVGRGYFLFMNGKLGTYSTKCRAVAAFICAVIWSQLAIALILSDGVPSIGIPVYAGLALGELRSVWRAARDHNGFFPTS